MGFRAFRVGSLGISKFWDAGLGLLELRGLLVWVWRVQIVLLGV